MPKKQRGREREREGKKERGREEKLVYTNTLYALPIKNQIRDRKGGIIEKDQQPKANVRVSAKSGVKKQEFSNPNEKHNNGI